MPLTGTSFPFALVFSCAGGRRGIASCLEKAYSRGVTGFASLLHPNKHSWLCQFGRTTDRHYILAEETYFQSYILCIRADFKGWGVSFSSLCTASLIWMRFIFSTGRVVAQNKACWKQWESFHGLCWALDLVLAAMKSKRQRNIEPTGFLASSSPITAQKMSWEWAVLHTCI